MAVIGKHGGAFYAAPPRYGESPEARALVNSRSKLSIRCNFMPQALCKQEGNNRFRNDQIAMSRVGAEIYLQDIHQLLSFIDYSVYLYFHYLNVIKCHLNPPI